MARAAKKTAGGDLGFEAELFRAADKLRGNMEPSDYKHVVLGLIFLSTYPRVRGEACRAPRRVPEGGAEDEDELPCDNIFWVPKGARWSHLQAMRESSPASARSSTTPCWRSRRSIQG